MRIKAFLIPGLIFSLIVFSGCDLNKTYRKGFSDGYNLATQQCKDLRLWQTTKPAQLIAWYPLNGSLADRSGNGYDLIPMNSCAGAEKDTGSNNPEQFFTYDRFGKKNSAYHFNGTSNYLVINGKGRYPQHTICAWFKTTVTTFNESWKVGPIIGSDYNATLDRIGRSYLYVSNKSVCISGGHPPYGGPRGPYGEVISKPDIDDGKWHFVVSEFDSATWNVLMYLDGEYIGDIKKYAETLDLVNGKTIDTRVEIGARCKKEEYFNGDIDDIRIYDGLLTMPEIIELYKSRE
jgi:hypothetical protein